jgi:Lysyl oxidase/Secretion system C-terminal sorting domain
MQKKLFTLLFGIFSLGYLSAQTPCDTLRLELEPDFYWDEVSWVITNGNGTEVYFSEQCTEPGLNNYYYCVPANNCTIFRINDDYGDGLTNDGFQNPDGYYKVFLNDSLLFENLTGEYQYTQYFSFGCPPGSDCASAFDIETGMHTADDNANTWYSFTPDSAGIYTLSTCFETNTCPTKIWVYGSDCSNIVLHNNNLGTLFYSDGGCEGTDLATAQLFLAGNTNYHIRIGHASSSCTDSIQFELTYDGPIEGCTDPTACNYNPLATISTDCIYPGDPDCPDAPDLVMVQDALLNSISQGFLFNPDECAVDEGCLRGTGPRTLVEFTTHIKNTGTRDYFIGAEPNNPSQATDQFIWDPCHNHWHYSGYAEYVLFDGDGTQVPIGTKNGFCVLDLECSDGGNPQYTCENMGISAGCGDIYDKGLPCQYIDITDIPAGDYTLVVRVNWDQSPDKLGYYESDYENNWAQACFTLSYINGSPDVEFNDDCPTFTDCAGTVFGSAQPDCDGVCNGVFEIGDWNRDTLRTMTDIAAYTTAAVTDTAAVTFCRDVHEDGHTSVYDAALLQECVLHVDNPSHWGTRIPCLFPSAGFQDPNDQVFLSLDTVDVINKTITVKMLNPFKKIMGYELQFSGIVIDSVENLHPTYFPELKHSEQRIVALSPDESTIGKSITPEPMLRLHFSSLTSSVVCIDSIIAVVNEKYNLSTATLTEPACQTIVSSTNTAWNTAKVQVIPNPATNDVHLFFDNPDRLPTQVQLTDVHGRLVREYSGIRDTDVLLPRNNLPAGVYQYSLRNEKGVLTGKLVWQ